MREMGKDSVRRREMVSTLNLVSRPWFNGPSDQIAFLIQSAFLYSRK